MADDFDVEAMLEAPFRKGEEVNGRSKEGYSDKENRRSSVSSSSGTKRKRSRSKERRSRSRSRGRRSRSRGRRSRSRSRDFRRRSRSRGRERKRSRSRSRDRKHHSRERERERKRSHSPRREKRHRSRSRSPIIPGPVPHTSLAASLSPSGVSRAHNVELTPEERDQRTIFCMQLSQRVRTRDLEEFFSSVGKVRDVRIIMDNKTRRSKGIAYIEFAEVQSVSLALGLSGQKLLGVPIIVQPTQAEKNRVAASANNLQKGNTGPMRLYVGSLHFNITEDMLKGIFEPFGKIKEA